MNCKQSEKIIKEYLQKNTPEEFNIENFFNWMSKKISEKNSTDFTMATSGAGKSMSCKLKLINNPIKKI